MSIKSFINKLRGNYLYEIEKLILDNIRNKLCDDIALIWDKQLRAINRFQRLPDGVEVDFFMIRNGRSDFDVELLFPNKTIELLLAKVQIELLGNKLVASVWCVRGHLFSIEYEGSINYFEDVYRELQSDVVIKSEIIADLSENISCEVKLPLLCAVCTDIYVYNSLEDAALLNPLDIYSNKYVFFDADGYIVEAYVVENSQFQKYKSLLSFHHNNVKIRFNRKSPLELRRDELIRLMIDFLNDRHESIDTNNLEDLINKFSFYQNGHFHVKTVEFLNR